MNNSDNAKPGINALRESISDDIEEIRAVEAYLSAPAVQEVVLARRHLEDARMRLGVATTILDNEDPFVEA